MASKAVNLPVDDAEAPRILQRCLQFIPQPGVVYEVHGVHFNSHHYVSGDDQGNIRLYLNRRQNQQGRKKIQYFCTSCPRKGGGTASSVRGKWIFKKSRPHHKECTPYDLFEVYSRFIAFGLYSASVRHSELYMSLCSDLENELRKSNEPLHQALPWTHRVLHKRVTVLLKQLKMRSAKAKQAHDTSAPDFSSLSGTSVPT